MVNPTLDSWHNENNDIFNVDLEAGHKREAHEQVDRRASQEEDLQKYEDDIDPPVYKDSRWFQVYSAINLEQL